MADLFPAMTVSCRLVETGWSSSQQDVREGAEGYRSLAGRHAVKSAGSVNFTLVFREEPMPQSNTGKCVSSSSAAARVEEEVVFSPPLFGLRSRTPDTCHFGENVTTDSVSESAC